MKKAYKLRFLPILAGVLFALFALAQYAGVSLPYQDATSEMLAARAAAVSFWRSMISAGMVIIVLGVIYCIVVGHFHKKRRVD